MLRAFGNCGEVWEWFTGRSSELCLLINLVRYDWEFEQEVWDVLDLSTVESGRLARAVLHERKTVDGRWERLA